LFHEPEYMPNSCITPSSSRHLQPSFLPPGPFLQPSSLLLPERPAQPSSLQPPGLALQSPSLRPPELSRQPTYLLSPRLSVPPPPRPRLLSFQPSFLRPTGFPLQSTSLLAGPSVPASPFLPRRQAPQLSSLRQPGSFLQLSL